MKLDQSAFNLSFTIAICLTLFQETEIFLYNPSQAIARKQLLLLSAEETQNPCFFVLISNKHF
ncbi:hypothetical protein GTQ43_29245 [Nostoc sp. KVJ3]|uniref:hypothetical protein n=1 Tax=Nostoc sp. KVJ3 TaxID=457945 RepID=UPI002238EB6E|nr:hypothetical protein [Nostoc sp. KVJ3]MCW5317715.1 hypothetical protein [Nostoc sp. KVJ3]